jgi:hypothetical protein
MADAGNDIHMPDDQNNSVWLPPDIYSNNYQRPNYWPDQFVDIYRTTYSTASAAVMAATEYQRLRHAWVAATQSMGTEIVLTPEELAAVENALEEEGRSDAVVPAPAGVLSWLTAIEFLIPKSFREPYLGDLREDLANMAKEGYSPIRMKWRVAAQLAMLLARPILELVKLARSLFGI